MTGRLLDKVAFVTGAGSGIGRASARLFAREGARVLVADIDAAAGQATVRDIGETGGAALAVVTDVTDEDSVRRAIAASVDRFGKLDILFNCAGGSVAADASVTDVDMAVWHRTQALDLLGPFLCCRHGIPELVKAGGGAVVNVSSMVALRGTFPIHAYTAAKGGVIAFTRAVAADYARHGIRANVICPGTILTERITRRLAATPTAKPMKPAVTVDWTEYPFSVGQPEDIASIALFLASAESRMITGAVIPADGGFSAY